MLLLLALSCARPPPPPPALPACDEGYLPIEGDWGPTCGVARDWPPGAPGPGRTRLRVAVSEDASSWVRLPETLIDQADVPSCVTVDGRLWVFFVLWSDRETRIRDRVAAVSTADLATWTAHDLALRGGPDGYRLPVDPTVVPVDPGAPSAGYRLYGAASPMTPKATRAVHTFVSTDLLDWTHEAGPGPGGAAWSADGHVFDPVAVWLPAEERYELLASGAEGHAHHRARTGEGDLDHDSPLALADEAGLDLKAGNGVVIDGVPKLLAAERVQPGGEGRAIRSLTRGADGRWTLDPEPVLVVGGAGEAAPLRDAAICGHPQGSGWVMIYAAGIPQE